MCKGELDPALHGMVNIHIQYINTLTQETGRVICTHSNHTHSNLIHILTSVSALTLHWLAQLITSTHSIIQPADLR